MIDSEEACFRLLSTTRWVLPLALLLALLFAAFAPGTRTIALGLALLFGGLMGLSRAISPVLILDGHGYRICVRGHERFSVPWSKVVRVTIDEEEGACYVDCGDRQKNLLLPPRGGFAFTFERRDELLLRIRRATQDRQLMVKNLLTAVQESRSASP
jgi:hypothetical protein